MKKEITFEEFEKNILNQSEIYFSGFGDSWDVAIYYNQRDGHYYLKGPFGRWDQICYYDLGPLTKSELQVWIDNFELESGRSAMPTRKDLKS